MADGKYHRSPETAENCDLANAIGKATREACDENGLYDAIDLAEALLNSNWMKQHDRALLNRASEKITIFRDSTNARVGDAAWSALTYAAGMVREGY